MTAIILAIVLQGCAPLTVSQNDQSGSSAGGDYSVSGPAKTKVGSGPAPEGIYLAITFGNMTGGSLSYTIPYMAITGADNLTTVYTFKTPLVGTYNATNDMGYTSTATMVPATAIYDTAGNSSLPVAGTSMIMGLKGITPVSSGETYKDSNIKQVGVFTPDGSVKTFTLDKPLRITHSEDRKIVVVDSYPSFSRRMRAVMGNNTTTAFPAGAPPMSLKTMDGAWATTTASVVSYEAPKYIPPPT